MTDRMVAVNAMRATYVALYERDAVKDAADKLDAMTILNPDGRCGYCQMPLTGGASTCFDHKYGDGSEWRKNRGITSRIEIRWIKNGTHPEPTNRTFCCTDCNQEKGKMNADEFVNTEFITRRRRMVEADGI